MDKMQKSAILGIFTRIREMISEDPDQPLKNISHLVEESLVAKCGLMSSDFGLVSRLNEKGKRNDA